MINHLLFSYFFLGFGKRFPCWTPLQSRRQLLPVSYLLLLTILLLLLLLFCRCIRKFHCNFMIMAARILIDTLALLRGHRPPEDRCVAPSTSALELNFDFDVDFDFDFIMMLDDEAQCSSEIQFRNEMHFDFFEYINLKVGPQQKTSCGAQIFKACGYKSGAHYARGRGRSRRTMREREWQKEQEQRNGRGSGPGQARPAFKLGPATGTCRPHHHCVCR